MEFINKINLIQTKSAPSSQLGIAMTTLRKFSIWTFVAFIISGILTSGIYYYVRVRAQQIAQVRQQLMADIGLRAEKEGLLASLKQRSSVITKILDIQRPLGNVLDTVIAFSPPEKISGISLDEKNRVTVTMRTESMVDVLSVTDIIIKQANAQRLRAPQLVSLSLQQDGRIDVGISFIQIF